MNQADIKRTNLRITNTESRESLHHDLMIRNIMTLD